MGIYVSKYKGKEIDDKLDKVDTISDEVYNISNTIDSVVSTKVEAATSKKYTISVLASGWSTYGTSGTDSYYRNRVSVSGMTSSVLLSCIELTDTYKTSSDAVTAYQTWSYLETASGYVYFYSATKPTTTFAVTAIEVK
jgi:hypothetical protein